MSLISARSFRLILKVGTAVMMVMVCLLLMTTELLSFSLLSPPLSTVSVHLLYEIALSNLNTDSSSVTATVTATSSDFSTSSALAATASVANGTVTLHNLTSTLTVTKPWSTAVSGTPLNVTKTLTLTDVLTPAQTSVGTISVHVSANHTQSAHWTNTTISAAATSAISANGTGATVTITYTVVPTPASSLIHTSSTSARPVNETVTITLWPTSHANSTVTAMSTTAITSGAVQSDVFSITADSSSWFKSSVLGTAISSSGSASPSESAVTLTSTVTHYGTIGASSSVETASTSESIPYSVTSTEDSDATSAQQTTTIIEQPSSEATPVVFTSTQYITVTQSPSISIITGKIPFTSHNHVSTYQFTDKSSSLAVTSTVTEQVSAETTTASGDSTSSEAVYTVTATGATVTVTVTNSGSLPNITTTAVPPYPVGNSTCSHAASGAYTNPTSAEAMCITITDSSTVATECFTVLPIVSSVTGEIITPSQTANATVLGTSSTQNNTGMFISISHVMTFTNIVTKATSVPTTFATSVSSSSSSSEELIPTHLPPSPNFPWGGDSPAHRHQNAATLGGGQRVRRFFNRL